MGCGIQSRNKLAGIGIERIGPHLAAGAGFAPFDVARSTRLLRRGGIRVSRRRTHFA